MSDISALPLQPSLWRTCRVLANRRRLDILAELLDRSPQDVSQIAEALGLSEAVASQYLRHLNARGLLRASRAGRFVSYSAQPDPTLYESVKLLAALRHALIKEKDSTDHIFNQVTAFTHWRRIRIVQCLAPGDCSFTDLMRRTSISRAALQRHLKKLIGRNYVSFDEKDGLYRLVQATSRLQKTLLRLALLHKEPPLRKNAR